jgi:hypothetical protein
MAITGLDFRNATQGGTVNEKFSNFNAYYDLSMFMHTVNEKQQQKHYKSKIRRVTGRSRQNHGNTRS